jgi:hypothetical protein
LATRSARPTQDAQVIPSNVNLIRASGMAGILFPAFANVITQGGMFQT